MQTISRLIVLLIAVVVIISVAAFLRQSPGSTSAINNFNECAQAGYPIMESYPRQCATPDGQSFTEEIPSSAAQEANIVVTSPQPNASVSNPFTITGQARVFESAFNYRLRDEDGSILVESHAMANAPDIGVFGPFSVEISYPEPSGDHGTLEVFSGSPMDGSEINKVVVPVEFE